LNDTTSVLGTGILGQILQVGTSVCLCVLARSRVRLLAFSAAGWARLR
jgi:hypothetical protein